MNLTEEYNELRRSCARAYMEHVRSARVRADALRDEIDMERESMAPKGMRFDRIGKSSPYADAIPDGVARIDGMVSRYTEQLREYMAEAEEAHDMLASLPDPRHAAVLTRRYVLGCSWCEVAADMGMAERSARRLGESALLELYPNLPAAWRVPCQPAV